jgi:uncharacterized protein YegP (UPF0339 family)
MAKFEVYRDRAGEHRWHLLANNNKIIADSGEGYVRKNSCIHGIDLVKSLAPDAEITEILTKEQFQSIMREEETGKEPALPDSWQGIERKSEFELYKDKTGKYRWRLRARNNKIIADSGAGHILKGSCEYGINLVKNLAPDAAIVEIITKEQLQALKRKARSETTVERDESVKVVEEDVGYEGGEFFRSFIHNNGGVLNNLSTFSVLSNTEDFGESLDEVVEYANKRKISTIFVIFAGQQKGDRRHTDLFDEFFCKDLTGGDRISDKPNWWKGQYRIYNEGYDSVASWLYQNYYNSALIIDVLNTKYEFEKTDKRKNKVFNYIFDVIYNSIFRRIKHKNDVKFFIIGFSRGAVLALRLADELLDQSDVSSSRIHAVVTIDPVIRPWSDLDKTRLRYWCFRKEKLVWVKVKKLRKFQWARNRWGEYKYVWDLLPRLYWLDTKSRTFPKWKPAACWVNRFPLLKGNANIVNYNVFERHSLPTYNPFMGVGSRDGNPFEYWHLKAPFGCAVENAVSPIHTNWSGRNQMVIDDSEGAGDRHPYNQLDTSIREHAPAMLGRYKDWIKFLVGYHVPKT